MDVQLTAGRSSREGAPTAAEVLELYAEATQGPPLSEPRAQAEAYGGLYGYVLGRDDVAWVAARLHGRLVGVAYGHDWRWERQTDGWSQQLAERLDAPAAAAIEGSLATYLLAVSPSVQRQGLGRRLLGELLVAAGTSRAWLQTRDEETPARTLYRSGGWVELGHGPDAPDGRPGLVLGMGLGLSDA